MKLKKIWNEYEFYSNQTSICCRQYGFAAVAICWLFQKNQIVPKAILTALLLILLFFLCDLMHYVWGARIHLNMGRRCQQIAKDKNLPLNEDEIDCDKNINDLNCLIYLFRMKIVLIVLAYIVIAGYYIHLIFGRC